MSENTRTRSSFPAFFFGICFTLLCLFAGGWLYFKVGHPPVATADKPFPLEREIAHVALHARVDRELQQPPFQASPAVLEAGAHVYMSHCASCHGTPGRNVAYAKYMFPKAPQLWQKHKNGVVGVSDDEPGKTYWLVENGVRLAGMPSYNHLLSKEQMWDVSLLLKNADQPMPEPVTSTLAAPPSVPLTTQ